MHLDGWALEVAVTGGQERLVAVGALWWNAKSKEMRSNVEQARLIRILQLVPNRCRSGERTIYDSKTAYPRPFKKDSRPMRRVLPVNVSFRSR